jgi:(2Fe-2S) ferredoxin
MHRAMPKRAHYLWVCTNERAAGHPLGSCAMRGSLGLLAALKQEVATRGLRDRLRVCGSTCLDLCWEGPAIAVMPDGTFYGNVTHGDVSEIVDSLEADTRVARLEIPEQAFDMPEGLKKK